MLGVTLSSMELRRGKHLKLPKMRRQHCNFLLQVLQIQTLLANALLHDTAKRDQMTQTMVDGSPYLGFNTRTL
jgi:hypothetical protein